MIGFTKVFSAFLLLVSTAIGSMAVAQDASAAATERFAGEARSDRSRRFPSISNCAGLATPLSVAEAAAARFGWPLRVIENCADDPPIEQPEAFVGALRAALGGV